MSAILLKVSEHPSRTSLHNEVHARPPEPSSSPLAISHIVMLCDGAEKEKSREWVMSLARDYHQGAMDSSATHLRLDLGTFKMRWELHTEFVTWTFIRHIDSKNFGEFSPSTAIEMVPAQWLRDLPGKSIVAHHLWVLSSRQFDTGTLFKHVLSEESLIASTVADGYAEVYTDFVLHADGFSRMVLLEASMTPRRLGRLIQCLLEIETYRMAALLGLTATRDVSAMLSSAENKLAELAQSIRGARREDEPELLDQLTYLASQVESQYAVTHSRFSASAAYFELVDKRIKDIAESRLAGLQMLGEFLNRRLTPARSTCEWCSRRQDSLSQRISRISNLLRTRVEIEQQESSQALLSSMNQRQHQQLLLALTVESLSVAAITYYFVGLISYLAKGAHAFGWPWSSEATAAAAVPIVAVAAYGFLKRVHSHVFKKIKPHE